MVVRWWRKQDGETQLSDDVREVWVFGTEKDCFKATPDSGLSINRWPSMAEVKTSTSVVLTIVGRSFCIRCRFACWQKTEWWDSDDAVLMRTPGIYGGGFAIGHPGLSVQTHTAADGYRLFLTWSLWPHYKLTNNFLNCQSKQLEKIINVSALTKKEAVIINSWHLKFKL